MFNVFHLYLTQAEPLSCMVRGQGRHVLHRQVHVTEDIINRECGQTRWGDIYKQFGGDLQKVMRRLTLKFEGNLQQSLADRI